MSDTSSMKATLVERLSSLLGFDDGAADVLDHLLSIESKEDLTDYLSQLLGRDNESVRTFVEDVGSFQRGEPLSQQVAAVQKEKQERKPPATQGATANEKKNKGKANTKDLQQQKSVNNNQVQERQKHKEVPTASNKKGTQSEKPPETNSMSTSNANNTSADFISNTVDNNSQSKQSRKQLDVSAMPFHPSKKKKAPPPPRGKATVVCGCFGTHHKPLTNCLYCGRISCEREGYDFCPFCGFLVEELKPPTAGNGAGSRTDEAWLHKERLLQFDRDFARRTVILDDQVDYFSNQTSAWLTEVEQADAEGQDNERRRDLHQRKKQQLDVAF